MIETTQSKEWELSLYEVTIFVYSSDITVSLFSALSLVNE